MVRFLKYTWHDIVVAAGKELDEIAAHFNLVRTEGPELEPDVPLRERVFAVYKTKHPTKRGVR